MNDFDRRQFLRVAGLSAAAIPLGGVLDACSSSGGSKAPSGGGSTSPAAAASGSAGAGSAGTGSAAPATGKVGTMKANNGSAPQDTYVNCVAAPVLYGKDFGLNFTDSDFVIFQSGSAAIQTTLGKQTGAVATGGVSLLEAIAQGAPFKVFQAIAFTDNTVIATNKPNIKTLADIKNMNAVVGVDSNTALEEFDAILLAQNTGFIVSDLKKVQDIESSGERASALAAGQVDVTIIHQTQADQIASSGKPVHVIASFYSANTKILEQGWMAPTEWLDKNLATAAAFCAATIKGSKALSQDQSAFLSACKQFLKAPPSDDALKADWSLISQHAFWPTTTAGIETDRIQNTIDLAVKEGFIEQGILTADKVIDTRPAQMAMQMLGS
ncbi:MAG TPA: ABC transporter substrate-binding protein [Acidobacteriaceae bacterium]|nr:ABC transporter substrate-binding protein [Acidobacteriaceae bacterium]